LEVWEIEQIRDYIVAPAILIGFSIWFHSGLWGWFKSGYNSSNKYELLKGFVTIAVVLTSSFGVLYVILIYNFMNIINAYGKDRLTGPLKNAD
jgi:hypothetical protein